MTDLMTGDTLAWLQTVAGNPVLLGLFVFGLVASAKRAVEQQQAAAVAAGQPVRVVPPNMWRIAAFGLGLVGSLALHATTGQATFGQGWLGAVPFGLLAGLVSIIGRDGLKTVASWFGLGALLPASAAATPALPSGPLPPGPGVVSEAAAQTKPQLGPIPTLRHANEADLTQMTGEWPAARWLDPDPALDTGSSHI